MTMNEMLYSLKHYNLDWALILFVIPFVLWASISACLPLSRWLRLEYGMIHRSGIPKGPAFLQAMEIAGRNPHKVIMKWIKRFGSIFWTHVGPYHVVILTDPILVADVCRTTKAYDKPSSFGNEAASRVCSDKKYPNLVSSTTNDHWRLEAFPAINGVVARYITFVEELNPSQPFNATKFMLNMAMDVIGVLVCAGVFGFSCDMGGADCLKPGYMGIDKTQISLAAFDETGKRGMDPFRHWKFWDPDVRKGERNVREFHELLMDIKEPATGKPLPDDRLLPEIGIFFLAGFETVASAMVWVLYAVSQNPEVEAKLTAELASLGLLASPGNPTPRPVQWDDLPKLAYLDAVIKESLRMWTPGAVNTTREALFDVSLGGKYLLPKGTMVWMPLYAIMRSAANWEDPDSFQPERFLLDGAELAKSDKTDPSSLPNGEWPAKRYIPFSEGPRNCVGLSLANVLMPTTLAALYSRFTFSLAPQMGGPQGVEERETFHVTLGIEGGLQLICRRRC
eukprot:jgi/Botrbrau1/9263/Bobra.180_1s0020.1